MKTKSCNVVEVKLCIVLTDNIWHFTPDTELCQTQQYCSILLTTSPHNIIASSFQQPGPTNNFWSCSIQLSYPKRLI